MVSRYDPSNDSYYHDMEGSGVICSAVDILPTEFAKEVSYFDPGFFFLYKIFSPCGICRKIFRSKFGFQSSLLTCYLTFKRLPNILETSYPNSSAVWLLQQILQSYLHT